MTASVPLSSAPPSRVAEFILDAEDFRQIAETLHASAGIVLSDQKMQLVYSRLTKRLRALGLSSFRDYCALIQDRDGADERQHMIAALTTNVTRFMREPHHFNHLRTVVLPPLLKRAAQGGRVRIWSAGCSSGQEPYSIAMTVLSLMPNAADRDIKILATDIDPNMIAMGQDGIYPDNEFSEMSRAERGRWLEPCDDGTDDWRVAEDMRRLVAFKELNLIGPWPMRGSFEVIFCRNVVIYFDEATQAKIWSRFAAALDKGGYMYVGHSERLAGPAKSKFNLVGPTMYAFTGERS